MADDGVGQAFQPVPQTGRPESLPHTRPTHGAIVFAKNEVVPISSTEIRRRVREGESIEELVDPRVARYIHHYGLYRKEQA